MTTYTAYDILRAMPDGAPEIDVEVYDTLDSTNAEAKRVARRCMAEGETLARPRLILACTQTAGRGRLGRDFYSPADTGLYMTLLYTTERPLTDAVAITGAAAVATATALESMTGEIFLIKWVNDIYRQGRKVCGILTEAVSGTDGQPNYMAVGIGINVTTERFPDGFRAPAACVTPAGQTPPDIAALAARVTAALLSLKDDPAAPETVDRYRARSMLTLQPTAVKITRAPGATDNEAVSEAASIATAVGIEDDYALRVRLPDGRWERLAAGEVSVADAFLPR